MVEQGQRQRQNAYDQHPLPPYGGAAPSYHVPRPPPQTVFEPSNVYVSIAKLTGLGVFLITAAIYLNNFQRDTQEYQSRMSAKMDEMVRVMKQMITNQDLSVFCMMAEKENSNWKCPVAFQWRRSGADYPKTSKRTSIRLGSR